MLEYFCENSSIVVKNPLDFSLPDTLDCGQSFRWTMQKDGSFCGIVDRHFLHISARSGTVILHNTSLEDFTHLWMDYFDLKTDYTALKTLFQKDPVLEKAIRYAPGIRVLRQKPWETLCSFIISQNNNVKRIKGIVDRLCTQFGEEFAPGQYAFPTPQRLSTLTLEDLSELRCGFRAKYILDAAKKVTDGTVNLASLYCLPLPQAREHLMQICGVGPKVADCALLYGFGRIECFPQDVWINRAMKELFPNGLPDFVLPYAGIAQQYIFHYVRTCPTALSKTQSFT